MPEQVILVLCVSRHGIIEKHKTFDDTPDGAYNAENCFESMIYDIIEENEGKSYLSLALQEPDFQNDITAFVRKGYCCEYGDHVYLLRSKVE